MDRCRHSRYTAGITHRLSKGAVIMPPTIGATMGLGLGNATAAVEGFGILCLASIGPIISVLLTGLWSDLQARRQARAARGQPAIHYEQELQAFV